MGILGTNWKTTAAALAILANLVNKAVQQGIGAIFNPEDFALIVTALGLLGAKDHNVTGGTKMQDGGTIPIIPERVDHLKEK